MQGKAGFESASGFGFWAMLSLRPCGLNGFGFHSCVLEDGL